MEKSRQVASSMSDGFRIEALTQAQQTGEDVQEDYKHKS